MEVASQQNSLRRGWDDTKLAWSNWRFLIAETIVGGGLAIVDPSIALISSIGLAAVVWIWKTIRAPYLQKSELSQALSMAENESSTTGQRLVRLEETLAREREDHASTKASLEFLVNENEAIKRALEAACPVWFHEESGATIIGKVGGPIAVQGGSFPYGLIIKGNSITLSGTSLGGGQKR